MTRFVVIVILLAAAASAFFVVAYFDLDRSYAGALTGIAALSIVSTLLVMLMRRPGAKSPAGSGAGAPALAQSAPAPDPATAPRTPETPSPVETIAVPAALGEQPDTPASRPQPPSPVNEHPAVKPRGYMGEENGPPAVSDYMRKRLAEPDEAAVAAVAASPPEAAVAAVPPAPAEAAEHPESAAGAFTPFAEQAQDEKNDASDGGGGGDRRPADEPPPPRSTAPRQPQASTPGPALPTTTPGLAPAALAMSVERASRALQRRLPTALDYYRREGVSSAVWAGVATSVIVTAMLWRLTRNGRSRP